MVRVSVKNWQKGEGEPLEVEGEIPGMLSWTSSLSGLPSETYEFLISVEEEGVVLNHTAQFTPQSFVASYPILIWGGMVYSLMTDGKSILVKILNDEALQLMMKWFFSQEERYCPSVLTMDQNQERIKSILTLSAERCFLEKNRWGNLVPVNQRRSFFLKEILFHYNPHRLSITAR